MQAEKAESVDIASSSEEAKAGSVLWRWARFSREAVVGSQQDFTEGSIGRAIFLLAVPMVLEMMMESLFGIINVFWVARLGATAAATVGITESLLTMVFAVALGLSMATTATVARRIGEKDHHGASVAAFQSIVLGAVASIPVAVIALTFAPQMFKLMGASEAVTDLGSGYARVILAEPATPRLRCAFFGSRTQSTSSSTRASYLGLVRFQNSVSPARLSRPRSGAEPVFCFSSGFCLADADE
jgi:hypothetical protein